MVWGCMGRDGVGKLVFIDGTMDSIVYVRILSENLNESAEKLGLTSFTFQQDNDPKHTSRYAKAYFEVNNITLMPWPSQSPDLNPIEHLWAHMKRKLKNLKPKNIRELKEMLIIIWNEITPDITAKLVDSMPRRVEAVIHAKGSNIKY